MYVMLVQCSNCRAALQLPPVANMIQCTICGAITSTLHPFCLSPPHYHNYHYIPPYPPPPPYGGVPPPLPPPSLHIPKKAVVCGISYRNTQQQLLGPINDAQCMRHLLMKEFGFPESSILMLTEDATESYKIPTKRNMMMGLHWLVQDCQPGDSLVFHFSGHGLQLVNNNGDEVDGYDECLCPLDYFSEGMIVDDELNALIVRPLLHGVKLHAIIDACHSGTALDLPYFCRMDKSGRYRWEDHNPPSGVWKGTSGGEAICFSSCDDYQKSIDTMVLSKTTYTGAMTYGFIQAIECGHRNTYGSILNSIRSTIDDMGKDGGGGRITFLSNFLTGSSLNGRVRQEPQLTASNQFDVYNKPFSL
uniref:Peptidase C14 caspase domain-containing protein n=1 Tax=Nelumbo nucifera TaxID=4432 RepID=A0A822XGY5_NELNU|nr:TPA_asm: hypothetical protein HUJ06_019752 [Nelumbo nucifera]